MNKIQIVNWLLTRKCNLKCEYCRIVKNYKKQPKEYPLMNHYLLNEMNTETVIHGLQKLKKHNPNSFNIFYGGEPLLRKDLPEIINYCNNNDIHYTIISNNTEEIQPLMDILFKKVSYIEGFTASIDPIIYQDIDSDIFKKSFRGFEKLKEYSSVIKDVVAEITATNDNLEYLYYLVNDLTINGINSDITFVDIAKNPYYDFSNVEDPKMLVQRNEKVADILDKIMDQKLNVHMRDTLLPKIYEILPSELDCGLEKDFHNLTVDADGSVRLCLRCRGKFTPRYFSLENLLDENGKLNPALNSSINLDKKQFCEKCNHTCFIMSKLISENEDSSDNLIHTEIRKEIK